MSENVEHPTPSIGAIPGAARVKVVDGKASIEETDYDGNPSSLVRTANDVDRDKPHPLYVVWEITLACDLGCRHCGSRAGPARDGELSTQECLDVVHQLRELGVREVTLIGGEAYLRDDWHVIATEITRCGMSVGMTTGARSLTQERVDQAVAAGLKTISISIDGLEKTHDAQRGVKGSWQAAVEASKRVAASPIRLATNTQINRLSMPELPAIADLLAEIGSKAWQIQITVAMGRAADRPDLLLQPFELLELFPLLVWIKETKLVPGGVQLFPGNNIGYFGPYEHLLRYGGHLGSHWTGCAAGQWTLGMEADGKVKGCPSLPSNSWTGGNVKDMTIEDIVRNTEELTHLSNRTVEDLWGFCGTCYYADICKGGCTWTAYCLSGKPGNNPYCIHRALEYEKQGKRERVVKKGPAPGLPFDHGLFDIVLEDTPERTDESAVVAGKALEEVLQLATKDPSIWDKESIISRLKTR
jgi:radical SAM protein with 4Fe4S-binding SPASM domain